MILTWMIAIWWILKEPEEGVPSKQCNQSAIRINMRRCLADNVDDSLDKDGYEEEDGGEDEDEDEDNEDDECAEDEDEDADKDEEI